MTHRKIDIVLRYVKVCWSEIRKPVVILENGKKVVRSIAVYQMPDTCVDLLKLSHLEQQYFGIA